VSLTDENRVVQKGVIFFHLSPMAMAVATAVTLSYRRSRTTSRDWSITNSVPVVIDKMAEPIIINIGGKKYETFEHTLNQFPNTLLGNPEKRKRYFDEKNNEYFFDRHRSSFTAILYYYQSGGLLERPLHVPNEVFLEELNFFQLTDEIQKENEEAACEEEENDDGEEEEEELPENKTLRAIWMLFEHPSSSPQAKALAVISLVIIMVSIVIFCVETMPVLDDSVPEERDSNGTVIQPAEQGKNKRIFFVMNAICSSWFTFEYVIRLIASPNKISFLKGVLNILDLLSILPFYVTLTVPKKSAGSIDILRVMRVIRVCRIFKLTRHSKGLHVLGKTLYASVNELIMLMLFLIIGVVLFASAAYYAEEESNPQFSSIPAAFWWAVVTMTTVGYGDVSPKTTPGKFVGALCALSGVLAIALPVPVIVSNFEFYYKEELSKREKSETISYRNLNNLVLKSPLLEHKLIDSPARTAKLDLPAGQYSSPIVAHRITNGAMKFGHDPIIETDEHSHSSGGSSKPSTPKGRRKQHLPPAHPTSETIL